MRDGDAAFEAADIVGDRAPLPFCPQPAAMESPVDPCESFRERSSPASDADEFKVSPFLNGDASPSRLKPRAVDDLRKSKPGDGNFKG